MQKERSVITTAKLFDQPTVHVERDEHWLTVRPQFSVETRDAEPDRAAVDRLYKQFGVGTLPSSDELVRFAHDSKTHTPFNIGCFAYMIEGTPGASYTYIAGTPMGWKAAQFIGALSASQREVLRNDLVVNPGQLSTELKTQLDNWYFASSVTRMRETAREPGAPRVSMPSDIEPGFLYPDGLPSDAELAVGVVNQMMAAVVIRRSDGREFHTHSPPGEVAYFLSNGASDGSTILGYYPAQVRRETFAIVGGEYGQSLTLEDAEYPAGRTPGPYGLLPPEFRSEVEKPRNPNGSFNIPFQITASPSRGTTSNSPPNHRLQ